MNEKKITYNELAIRQKLPLELKENITLRRIAEWIDVHGEECVYVSYSGGKDSVVTAHLTHRVNPNIPLVFCDTTLELPEIRSFAMNNPLVTTIKPKRTVREVLTKYGYPVVSKDVSNKIYKFRKNNLTDSYRDMLLNGCEKGTMGKIPDCHKYLIDTDFVSSAHCCSIMKKQPFHAYEKKTGRIACITGEMASESLNRRQQYMKYGCNAFDRKQGPKSTPIGFWTEQDVLEYILKYNVDISSAYGDVVCENGKLTTTGEKRTGCIFCLYGLQYDPDRFKRLKEKHPDLYDYCMRGGKHNENGEWVPHQGLGMEHVIKQLEGGYEFLHT